MVIDTSKLSRVTVVDERGGRVYERYQADVELQVQDDGKTLKVFVRHNPTKPRPKGFFILPPRGAKAFRQR